MQPTRGEDERPVDLIHTGDRAEESEQARQPQGAEALEQLLRRTDATRRRTHANAHVVHSVEPAFQVKARTRQVLELPDRIQLLPELATLETVRPCDKGELHRESVERGVVPGKPERKHERVDRDGGL